MTINTAVIGCGPAARNQHIPAIQLNPKSELVGLCDPDTDALRKAAIDGVSTYEDVEKLVEDQDLDSVHVCTPPTTRVEIAETVVPEGINVLFEKPVAATVEDVERLQELVAEHDVQACVVHNKLFTPYFQEARERISRGEIGDVVAADMLYSTDKDLSDTHRSGWVQELPGGEIGEGLPHRIYLALDFCNRLGAVDCISHRDYSGTDNAEFDGICIQMRDDSGDQLITIRLLTNTLSRETLTVYGTDGELKVDNNLKGVTSSEFDDLTASGLVSESLNQVMQLVANVAKNAFGYAKRKAYRQMDDPRGEQSDSHYVLIDRYLDSIQYGSEPPVTLEVGKETIRVLQAVNSQLESG